MSILRDSLEVIKELFIQMRWPSWTLFLILSTEMNVSMLNSNYLILNLSSHREFFLLIYFLWISDNYYIFWKTSRFDLCHWSKVAIYYTQLLKFPWLVKRFKNTQHFTGSALYLRDNFDLGSKTQRRLHKAKLEGVEDPQYLLVLNFYSSTGARGFTQNAIFEYSRMCPVSPTLQPCFIHTSQPCCTYTLHDIASYARLYTLYLHSLFVFLGCIPR